MKCLLLVPLLALCNAAPAMEKKEVEVAANMDEAPATINKEKADYAAMDDMPAKDAPKDKVDEVAEILSRVENKERQEGLQIFQSMTDSIGIRLTDVFDNLMTQGAEQHLHDELQRQINYYRKINPTYAKALRKLQTSGALDYYIEAQKLQRQQDDTGDQVKDILRRFGIQNDNEKDQLLVDKTVAESAGTYFSSLGGFLNRAMSKIRTSIAKKKNGESEEAETQEFLGQQGRIVHPDLLAPQLPFVPGLTPELTYQLLQRQNQRALPGPVVPEIVSPQFGLLPDVNIPSLNSVELQRGNRLTSPDLEAQIRSAVQRELERSLAEENFDEFKHKSRANKSASVVKSARSKLRKNIRRHESRE